MRQPLQPQDQLTLFTTCKPFEGEAALLQTNAIRSWVRLGISVIIVGRESGAAEIAKELNITHIADVNTNARGVPLVNALFDTARAKATTPYVGYINADIILLEDFLKAFQSVINICKPDTRLLLTARRQNIPVTRTLIDKNGSINPKLHQLHKIYGTWDKEDAIDLFLISKKTLMSIPPFSIGRMQWDNWLLWKAYDEGAVVVDASLDMTLLHPIHGYTSHQYNWQEITQGPEAKANRELAQGKGADLNEVCTHILDDGSLLPIDAASSKKLKERCCPTPLKEYLAGLFYLYEGFETRETEATFDALKVLLWRKGAFFPVTGNASPSIDKPLLKSLLHMAYKKAQNGQYKKSCHLLQDELNLTLRMQIDCALKQGRHFFIWGAGTMGLRAYSHLKRHKLPIMGFIDSDTRKVGKTMVDGLQIYGLEKLTPVASQPVPFILIASMYIQEISNILTNTGLLEGDDFTA